MSNEPKTKHRHVKHYGIRKNVDSATDEHFIIFEQDGTE